MKVAREKMEIEEAERKAKTSKKEKKKYEKELAKKRAEEEAEIKAKPVVQVALDSYDPTESFRVEGGQNKMA